MIMDVQQTKSESSKQAELVKGLIKLQEIIDEAVSAFKLINDIDEKAKCDLSVLYAKRMLEDTITEIGKQPKKLVEFAYELRMTDLKNIYSYDFLNGNVQPDVLVKIVLQACQGLVLPSRPMLTLQPTKSFALILQSKDLHLTCSSKYTIQLTNDFSANLALKIVPCQTGFLILSNDQTHALSEIKNSSVGTLGFVSLSNTESITSWLLIPSDQS